jgi:glycerophosphoryl diester phosphodiesterase
MSTRDDSTERSTILHMAQAPPLPRNIAHRGASGLEPENTIRAFRRAEELGADGLELDIRVTADRKLVVIHDVTVGRTTNGFGPVRTKVLAELQRLDAGMGERIPTFEEVIAETALPIQAELKTRQAAKHLTSFLLREHVCHRVRPISFEPRALRHIKARVPEVEVGLVATRASARVVERARWAGASLVSLGVASVTAGSVALCRDANLRVSVWTVDDPAEMRRVIQLGVDAIVTNRPDVLAQVMRAE